MGYYWNDDFLEHHGIKGQKWYVRRFQNEDGTLTPAGRERYNKIMDKQSMKDKSYTKTSDLVAKTLPAGMKVRRITTADENLNNSRLAYFSYTQADQANLRSITPWLMNVRGKKVEDAVEKNYTLNNDVKIPSQKEVDDIMKSIIKDPKERKKVNQVAIMDRWFGPGSNANWFLTADKQKQEQLIKNWTINEGIPEKIARETMNANLKYYKDKYNEKIKQGENILKDLSDNAVMEADNYHYGKSLMSMAFGDSKSNYQEQIVNELKKRGYGGMYDNAMISAGTSNGIEAYESIILFDPGKSTKDTGISEKMTNEKVQKAELQYQQWRKPRIDNRNSAGYRKDSDQIKKGLSSRVKAFKSSGMTYDEIAERLNIYPSQVEYYLNYRS